MIRSWLAAALLTIAACTAAPPPPLPVPAVADYPIEPRALCADLHRAALLWSAVADQRFHHPVVVAVHGCEYCGVWLCFPDAPLRPMPVQSLAECLHVTYPHSDVVLLCCNPAGDRIHVAGVWYARKLVWCVPKPFRVYSADDAVGAASLDEFVCTP